MALYYSCEERLAEFSRVLEMVVQYKNYIFKMQQHLADQISRGIQYDDIYYDFRQTLDSLREDIQSAVLDLEALTWTYCEMVRPNALLNFDSWSVFEKSGAVGILTAQDASSGSVSIGLDNVYIAGETINIFKADSSADLGIEVLKGAPDAPTTSTLTLTAAFGLERTDAFDDSNLTIKKHSD